MTVKEKNELLVKIARLLPEFEAEATQAKRDLYGAVTFMATALYGGNLENLDVGAFCEGMRSPGLCKDLIRLRSAVLNIFKTQRAMGNFPHEEGFSPDSAQGMVNTLVTRLATVPKGIRESDVARDIFSCRMGLITHIEEQGGSEVSKLAPCIRQLEAMLFELIGSLETAKGSAEPPVLTSGVLQDQSVVKRLAQRESTAEKRKGVVFEDLLSDSVVDFDATFLPNSIFDPVDLGPDTLSVYENEHFGALPPVFEEETAASASLETRPMPIKSAAIDSALALIEVIAAATPPETPALRRANEDMLTRLCAMIKPDGPPQVAVRKQVQGSSRPTLVHDRIAAWEELVNLERNKLHSLLVLEAVVTEIIKEPRNINAEAIRDMADVVRDMLNIQRSLVRALDEKWGKMNSDGLLTVFDSASARIGELQAERSDLGKASDMDQAAKELRYAQIDAEILAQKQLYNADYEVQNKLVGAYLELADICVAQLPAISAAVRQYEAIKHGFFSQPVAGEPSYATSTKLASILPESTSGSILGEKWKSNSIDALMAELGVQRVSTYPLLIEGATKKLGTDVASHFEGVVSRYKGVVATVNDLVGQLRAPQR